MVPSVTFDGLGSFEIFLMDFWMNYAEVAELSLLEQGHHQSGLHDTGVSTGPKK